MEETKLEKSFDEKSFTEALAEQANKDKSGLVLATLQAFRDGEPSAIKLVNAALLEHQYNEENTFPISDARFKEIIKVIATAIGTGEV